MLLVLLVLQPLQPLLLPSLRVDLLLHLGVDSPAAKDFAPELPAVLSSSLRKFASLWFEDEKDGKDWSEQGMLGRDVRDEHSPVLR